MTDLFGNLIRVTLSMSVLIACVLLCTPFLKKRYSAGWRYWVWMVIAMRLLIPFQMSAIELPDLSGRFQTAVSADWPQKQVAESQPVAGTELLSQQETAVRQEQTAQIQQQKEPLPVVPAEQETQTALWAGWAEKLAAFPWIKAGMVVWMLGTAVMLVVHLMAGNRIRRLLRTCTRPVQNPNCQAIWKEIKDKTGYFGPMRLAYCPAVSSPMVVGLRRPQLLLPREDYPAEALEMIFRHELVHVMRHDLWYKLLLIAASTIHWFNPLVHWMVKAADRDLEISCDEKVTRRTNRDFRAQYGEAIFEVLQRDSGKKFFFTTNFSNEKKILMQRFDAIFNTKRKHRGTAAMCVVLSVCLLTGSMAGCQADPAQPESQQTESESSSVFTGSENVDVDETALAQMDWIAQLYEWYRSGINLAESETAEGVLDLGFGYLKEKDMLKPYLDERGEAYGIPKKQLAEIHNFFMASSDVPDDSEQIDWYVSFYGVESRDAFTLEASGIQKQDDGDIVIDYRRAAGDAYLRPVRYVFRPHKIESVPAALAADYSQGDTVYQIVSVTNLDMEQQPLCQTIEISNAQELLAAAERMNAGGWLNQHDTYRLTADIDLSGIDFTPMGQNERYLGHWDEDDPRDPTLRGFNGTFDGQGHTISGLRLKAEEQDYLKRTDYVGDGVGLFSLIGTNGMVKNLNLKDCVVTSPCRYGAEYGAAGLLAGTCNGMLEFVSVEGTVDGGYEVGGVAGRITGTAYSCDAAVSVSGYGEVGAFAGSFCYGRLENCTASGQVRAVPAQGAPESEGTPTSIGGFIGFSVLGTMYGCESSVYLSTTVSSNWVGAFAGYAQSVWVENCAYDAQKAPGWEAIDVVYDTNDVEQNVKAK